MSSLRSNVLAAKERLAAGRRELQRRHEAGRPGIELCAALSDLRDEVVLDLTRAALDDLHEGGPNGLWSEIALVAHGGYGRRDVAPFSDVDLMILHEPAAGNRVAPLGRAAVARRVRRRLESRPQCADVETGLPAGL